MASAVGSATGVASNNLLVAGAASTGAATTGAASGLLLIEPSLAPKSSSPFPRRAAKSAVLVCAKRVF